MQFIQQLDICIQQLGTFIQKLWAPSFNSCGHLHSTAVGTFIKQLWVPSFNSCGHLHSTAVGTFIQQLWAPSLNSCGYLHSTAVGTFIQQLWAPSFNSCGHLNSTAVGTFIKQLWAPSFNSLPPSFNSSLPLLTYQLVAALCCIAYNVSHGMTVLCLTVLHEQWKFSSLSDQVHNAALTCVPYVACCSN